MHRKTMRATVMVLLVLYALPLSGAERGLAVKARLPSGETIRVYDDSWAVVIGINAYQHWPTLDYAVQDAEDVKALLMERLGFQEDHIFILTDQDATLVSIREVLGGVLPQKAGSNDRVLIFWAGHGQTVELPEGGHLGFLVPVDGSTEETRTYATCLSMTEIKTLCGLIPAKHILFLVDACYSGLAASATYGGLSKETKGYLRKVTRARVRQILTAGQSGEQVIEHSQWGHSAFTHQLLEGFRSGMVDLDDDGIVTSSELATYMIPRVTKLSGNRQTPRFRYLEGEGEFVFVLEDVKGEAARVAPPSVVVPPRPQPPAFYKRRWFWTVVGGVTVGGVVAVMNGDKGTSTPTTGTIEVDVPWPK